VRDDDYRLSFLHGHYITLTNLSEEDYSRIIEEKLSPLCVSVQAT
jgi:NifB/MoaA-like Fe-S oxidoreductase